MKRTCDMEVGETFQINEEGILKTMIVTSKETDENGFLIVRSQEVVA